MIKRIFRLLANLHFVAPDIARCAQPLFRTQWDAILEDGSISSILNLRGENPTAYWYRDELEACAAHGIKHKDLAISSKRLPSTESLLEIMQATRLLPRPLLIKCAGGADRTGLVCAMIMLARNGADGLSLAHRQLRAFPYLHTPKPQQRWIRAFLDFYKATTTPDQTFEAWLRDQYSERAFANYLTSCGKGDFWRTS